MRAPNCATGPRWNIASTLFVTCGCGAVNQGIDPCHDLAQVLLERGAKARLPAAAAMHRTQDVERLLHRDPGTLKPGGSMAHSAGLRGCARPGRDCAAADRARRGSYVTITRRRDTQRDRTDSQGSGGRGRSPKLAPISHDKSPMVRYGRRVQPQRGELPKPRPTAWV
jgi:hypothetical protein